MFNLNEDNRIVMAQHPTDMRKGVNTLCGEVRRVGLDPTNGDVYIFVGKSRKVMKLLHGIGFRSMKWSELVLLMEGISPHVSRRRRYEKE